MTQKPDDNYFQGISILTLTASGGDGRVADSLRGRGRHLSPPRFTPVQFSSLRAVGIRMPEKVANWLRDPTFRMIFLNTWKSMQFVQDLIPWGEKNLDNVCVKKQ